VINSEAVGDYSGFSVSSAGDVNGDGLDDLIVGAYTADPVVEQTSPLITNPPKGLFASAMVLRLMALLSTLPNTTYDLPDSNVPSGLANGAPTIKSSKPSPLTSPALETEMPLRSFAASPFG
jgi:hypothetical protein